MLKELDKNSPHFFEAQDIKTLILSDIEITTQLLASGIYNNFDEIIEDEDGIETSLRKYLEDKKNAEINFIVYNIDFFSHYSEIFSAGGFDLKIIEALYKRSNMEGESFLAAMNMVGQYFEKEIPDYILQKAINSHKPKPLQQKNKLIWGKCLKWKKVNI